MAKRKTKSRRQSEGDRPADKAPEFDLIDSIIDDLRALAKKSISLEHSPAAVAALKQLADLLALKGPADGLTVNVDATIELTSTRDHLLTLDLVDNPDDVPTSELARLVSLRLLQK